MRGRKPKPLSIRELEGNPGHRPLPNAPAPPTNLPPCPRHLSKGAKKIWKTLGDRFVALGVIADVDEMAFAMLCQAYADWIELTELARKDGPVVRVNGQPQPNPYAVRADRAAEQVRRMLAEFGGSPASRARLTVNSTTVPGAADDVTAFLAQTGAPRMRIAK